MRFVMRTFGLAGAASIISMNAAYAGELASPPIEDFFDSMLELDEAPMTAAALSEARGGFSIGGLQFNIGVQLPPPVVSPLFPEGGPLPNGPFGANGGPFGNSGGPLPNGPFGNNGNSNNAGSNNAPAQSNAPPHTPPGAQALAANAQAAAEQAAQAAAQHQPPVTQSPANVQPASTATPQSPPPSTGAPQSVLTLASPAAAQPPAAQQSPSPQQTQAAPTPAPAATPATATSSPATTTTQSSPSTPQTNVASQNNVSGAPGGNLPQQNEVPDAMPVQSVSVASAGDENNGAPPAEAKMSMVLSEVDDPEVIQQIGMNGVTTIFNNAQNNVRLTARVNMNVEVQNYGFVMGMTRAANLTTQAVTQNFFLRGLN